MDSNPQAIPQRFKLIVRTDWFDPRIWGDCENLSDAELIELVHDEDFSEVIDAVKVGQCEVIREGAATTVTKEE